MRRSFVVSLLAVAAFGALVAGCATTPPEEDPVQIKLNDLDARLTRIERILNNQDFAQRLEDTQNSVRQLRGRMDVLENSTESMRKQQRDLYNDLEKKLGALQGAPPPPPPPNAFNGTQGPGGNLAGGNAVPPSGAPATGAPAVTNNAPPGPGNGQPAGGSIAAPGSATPGAGGSSVEQAVYNQAFDALKASSYSVAITGFRDFLSTYPASPLAENAQYWLGEAYYVTRDFGNASTSFRSVLDKWPNSRKAPDALLKLGYTQYELKRYGDARTTLTEVTQKFPNTDAAKLANDRLARIPANSR